MKKLLTFSIVFALVCATVFAEVTVTAGAGMSFIPLGVVIKPDDDDPDTDDGPAAVAGFGRGGGAATEIQVNVEGATESGKAGFKFQWRPKIAGSTLTSEIGDNAGIWYKPLDWIRLDAGRFTNNDIRGKVGNSAWFGDYLIPRTGESDIFTNFGAKAAAMLTVKPEALAGLSVYALVNNMVDTYGNWAEEGSNKFAWGGSKGAEWVWQNTQAAVAYDLPNIGLVRVQFVGSPLVSPSESETKKYEAVINGKLQEIEITTKEAGEPGFNAHRFELAFAYTGMEGLTIDVGGRVYLPVKDPQFDADLWNDKYEVKNYSYWKGIGFALGAKYVTGALTANFIIGASGIADTVTNEMEVGKKKETTNAFVLKPYVAVQYKLNDTFTAQLEGGVQFTGDKEEKTTIGGTSTTDTTEGALAYGFGLGLQTTLAPDCTIKTGLTFVGGTTPGTPDNKDLHGVFSVPIIFSVSF
ncbi:MAG: hypothetical protein LBP76_01255 [Treponema sp.]|nr:hypothetical protein [Treponema sp.]